MDVREEKLLVFDGYASRDIEVSLLNCVLGILKPILIGDRSDLGLKGAGFAAKDALKLECTLLRVSAVPVEECLAGIAFIPLPNVRHVAFMFVAMQGKTFTVAVTDRRKVTDA